MPITTFRKNDIVVVPFPFTDKKAVKRRPALVISSKEVFNQYINHVVLAMITTTKNINWPLDLLINNLQPTGLSHSSIIRMKLFTLDCRLILRKIGVLSKLDSLEVNKALKKLFIK